MKKDIVEYTAKLCHEGNKLLCELHGDNSQKSWEDAEGWQRDAAIEGVKQAINGVSHEELHNQWMEKKKKDGWVYGDVKDGVKKTHPDMIPYEELSPFAKSKDFLFNELVNSFIKAVAKSLNKAE